MKIETIGVIPRLLLLTVCFALISGCSSFEFGHRLEFGSHWVSREGKSQEDLQRDQAECRREISLVRAPTFSPVTGDGAGWEMDDMKVLESCMRAKGWVKE